jgi:integrase/recombinase XerD
MSRRSSKAEQELWRYVRTYLTIYLPKIRDLSPRTVDSYRQSISMYCSFLKEYHGTDFSRISFDQITRASVLEYIGLLRGRCCRPSTCNLRLSSLKSFLKYCADEDVALHAVYQEVKKIPVLRAPKEPVKTLSETALRALMAEPDSKTTKGMRNRMIMILLYDTGVRVQELVDLRIGDLQLHAKTPFIIVTGKGSKTRSVPLMDKTVAHLTGYLKRFHGSIDDRFEAPLFYSTRLNTPHKLSTDAVAAMLKNYAEAAAMRCAEIPARVHPHLFRHTRAMDLYRAGMPLSYISEFLGHANMSTTEIYASADTRMLRDALEKADPEIAEEVPAWKDEETLRKLCGL